MKPILALLLFCSPVFGQLSVCSSTAVNSGHQTLATYSFNLTISSGCTNNVLYAVISEDDAGTPATVSTFTHNGAALTSVISSASSSGQVTRIYRKIAPTNDGAAHSISLTLSGAPTNGSMVSVVVLSGAHQTTPEDGTCSNTSASATALNCSATITTTVANDYYVVGGTGAGGGFTFGLANSATAIGTLDQTGTGGAGYKSLGAAGAIAPGVTLSPAGAMSMAATAIQPAGASVSGSMLGGPGMWGGPSQVQ